MAVEEHGGGRQQLRFRIRPRAARGAPESAISFAILASVAASSAAPTAAIVLAALAAGVVAAWLLEAGSAIAAAQRAIRPAPASVPAPAAALDRHGPRRADDLLRELYEVVSPGEIVAVVGSQRCRRQALSQLLAALSDAGADGEHPAPTAAGRAPRLYRDLSILPQDPVILAVSISDNIALGRPGAPHEQIHAAARAAGIEDLVSHLPHGLDTPIGSCMALSGPERQGVWVARAFLRDAPILVVAHPLAGGELEAPTLRRLRAGRRTLVVVEDIEHAAEADHVLVLADGRVAEQGRRHELLRRADPYAALRASA